MYSTTVPERVNTSQLYTNRNTININMQILFYTQLKTNIILHIKSCNMILTYQGYKKCTIYHCFKIYFSPLPGIALHIFALSPGTP